MRNVIGGGGGGAGLKVRTKLYRYYYTCTDCENTISLVYYSGVRSQFLLWGGGNNPNVPTEKEEEKKDSRTRLRNIYFFSGFKGIV